MKKALVSLAALAAVAGAQAAVVTIDGFDTPGVSNTGSFTSTDAVRTVTVDATAGTSSLDIGATSSTGSALEVSNRVGQDSTVNLSWTLGALSLPSNATNIGFFLQVLESDGNPTSLDFTLNGSALSSFTIPGNTVGQGLSFTLTSAEWATLSAGGTLGLELNGASGWDLAIDTFGVSYDVPVQAVPEPGSLALVGLALAGVAVAARRRKA